MADEIVAVHLGTGELLEHLEQQPPALLAEALVLLREKQADLAKWEKALVSEFDRRMTLADRTLVVYGDYEVEQQVSRRSSWDVDEFEHRLAELIEQGVVKRSEVTEVVRRTRTVAASEANRLIARLKGGPRRSLEETRTWREERGKLKVVRSVQLPAPEVKRPRELSADELFQ